MQWQSVRSRRVLLLFLFFRWSLTTTNILVYSCLSLLVYSSSSIIFVFACTNRFIIFTVVLVLSMFFFRRTRTATTLCSTSWASALVRKPKPSSTCQSERCGTKNEKTNEENVLYKCLLLVSEQEPQQRDGVIAHANDRPTIMTPRLLHDREGRKGRDGTNTNRGPRGVGKIKD